jgi:Rrf2 family nitric oxide-sensitive transcriptional repressor
MLIHLAVNNARPARVADVASSYRISRNHLLKVALSLGRLGYVKTVRGRSGGIALAKSPERIILGEVVRQLEDDFALVECMRAEGGKCVISPACRLRSIVRKALDAFLAVFDQYTLADLVENRDVLSGLLGLKADIEGTSMIDLRGVQ